jgi:hypothetical protein
VDGMQGLWDWQGHGGPFAVVILTVIFAAGIALLALWIALPVAVFGVRSALRELVAAQGDTNRELAEIRRRLEMLAPRGETSVQGESSDGGF